MNRISLVIPLIFPLVLIGESAPYPTLAETGFYTEPKEHYTPRYPLYSDGAVKSRWMHLPSGSAIDASNPDYWVFPNGTKLWKEFNFLGHKVETRYLEKDQNGKWFMATYLWNADETEATLADVNGIQNYYEIKPGVKVNIPSVAQCRFCHERGGDYVLSADAVQISVSDLIESGRLVNFPDRWKSDPPQIHARSEVERNALGYMHGNCGHCHNPTGRANMSELFLRHTESATSALEEPAIVTAVDKLTKKFQIPGASTTYRVKSQNLSLSAIHFRMDTMTKAAMPPIGRKTIDEDAVDLIRRWIEELN